MPPRQDHKTPSGGMDLRGLSVTPRRRERQQSSNEAAESRHRTAGNMAVDLAGDIDETGEIRKERDKIENSKLYLFFILFLYCSIFLCLVRRDGITLRNFLVSKDSEQ
jgi:hypothetical protein